MKNIHLIPTEKPSRLVIDTIENKLYYQPILHNKTINVLPQNIYITSDVEDINENDYIITKDGKLVQVSYLLSKDLEGASKVILTTDQDLIKDGVQPIDDEFLEWFVKNPSCEEVEVEKQMLCDYCGQEHCDNLRCRGYKDSVWYEIIISQEEPKQLTDLKIAMKLEEIEKEESKQDYSGVHLRHCYQGEYEDGCKYGEDDCPAKLLEKIEEDDERMYSEEEVYKLLLKHQSDYRSSVRNSYPLTWSFDIKDWFEQFKKK